MTCLLIRRFNLDSYVRRNLTIAHGSRLKLWSLCKLPSNIVAESMVFVKYLLLSVFHQKEEALI